jgi:hypothetical protein
MPAKFSTDKSIDIDEIIRQSKQNVPFVDEDELKRQNTNHILENARKAAESQDDAPAAQAPQTPPKQQPVVPGLILEEDTPENEPEPEYNGPGIVMTKEEYSRMQGENNKKGVKVTPLNDEVMDNVKEYMKEQDDEILRLKKTKEEMEAKGIGPINNSPQNIVNIYIDKAKVGDIALTPEQQKKVEMAHKIVVTETTELNFKTLKIRRPEADATVERKRKDSIIKKAFDRTLSPFIALGSGYLGKMGNCSVAEIMRLGRQIDSGRNLDSELDRWTLLYEKMKYCSIGLFDTFDDFLKNTAYSDYENLQFAVICASFPSDTTLQFTCPKCKNVFNVTVKNRELMRTDLVDQSIAETVHDIISSDTFLERAKEVHENALFNKVTRISVDDENLILLDMYMPSAYDAIHRTYEELTNPKKDDQDYESYADLIRMIKCVYIADEDEEGEAVYDAFEDVNDIFEVISHFTEEQLNKIAQYVQNSYINKQYYYGIKEVVCTNPKCKHNMGEYPMNMDTLLFHKVRPQ